MTDAPDQVRLFIACEVPDDVKESIGGIIETLRGRSGTAVRWIRAEGVHVTLKFLGEVPLKKMPAIKLAIQEAVVGHQPFELEFSNIGTFGGREGLRIMWVGIAGDVLRLEALVRAVNAALAVVGFEPERRPFRPHLTLGRVKDEIPTRQRAEIEVAVGKMAVPGISWRTAQVSLMRSNLTPGGASYEVLATFPLRIVQQALGVRS
jgi:2'-5' RNA ligase